ncbi:uncharacterized protein LOC133131645 [Conger conger]|uniref:uncharacterized protein LOC133131645 n=1 Tax=Conger conger TaxID=82655 RepID=UPI002A5A8261|nr:uncharacterized protein LOC133131645 [Conger conger]
MVDGFIALLQGDRKTAEAKGYKDFLDLAGIRDLKPGSILQNVESQTVVGCSAKVSEDINDYIIQAAKPGASATIKVTKAAQAGTNLYTNLSTSFKALRDKLKERRIDLPEDVQQNRRSTRGEHVFNNALLGFCGSIIDLFIERHVTKGNRVKLVDLIPNSSISDAFQGNAPDGKHINLTADQRQNIRTWVVHIPDNVVYIPINNILFAHIIGVIRRNAVDYIALHFFFCPEKAERNWKVRSILAQTVEWMHMHRVYLDPQVVEMWFSENSDLIPQFPETENGVQHMLRQLDPERSTLLRNFANDLTLAQLVGFH